MPAIKPELAPFGLFSVATVVEHTAADSHWVNGFDFETTSCGVSASIMPICAPGTDDLVVVDPQGEGRFRRNMPFAVKVTDSCLSIGWNVHDRKQATLDLLDAAAQLVVETELWTGAATSVSNVDEGQWLASTNAEVLGGGAAVSVMRGLAMLERALGSCGIGARGVIHAPKDAATLLAQYAESDDDDKYLYTKSNHNYIVSGGGYTGSAPGEETRTDEGKPWIYATGPLVVHLGANELITPQLSDAFNARNNEITWIAAKPAAVYWDGCCHFGVQVDLDA
jgi:hypothetical protein